MRVGVEMWGLLHITPRIAAPSYSALFVARACVGGPDRWQDGVLHVLAQPNRGRSRRRRASPEVQGQPAALGLQQVTGGIRLILPRVDNASRSLEETPHLLCTCASPLDIIGPSYRPPLKHLGSGTCRCVPSLCPLPLLCANKQTLLPLVVLFEACSQGSRLDGD